VSSCFVTVRTFVEGIAVDVTDVHALNPVSILDFVAENMIFYAVL